jgi:addiction module RelE/StbE family toxin
MRRLVWDSSFRRAFKRATRRNPALRERIFDVISRLTREPFDPILRTHALRGQLEGLYACRVEYDCRIVFSMQTDSVRGEDVIILVDIGTHEEVY